MGRIINRNPFEIHMKYTDGDLQEIQELAEGRQKLKDQHPGLARDTKISKMSYVKSHRIGLLGETAISRLIYIPIDTNFYLGGGEKDYDFILYGVTIEVKTLQGYLAFEKLEHFKADVGVLVIYDPMDHHHVWVQGWIPSKIFREDYFTDNFGYGDRPCMQPAALLPIVCLQNYCLTTKKHRWLKRENSRGFTLTQIESI